MSSRNDDSYINTFEKKLQRHVGLAPYCSWQVGGTADYFFMPESVSDLQWAQKWTQEKKIPMTILGAGSNVLISDQGLRGLTLVLKKFSKYEVAIHEVTADEVATDDQQVSIICEAGVAKSELLKIFLKYQKAPALFLAGLPGEVSGGVVMNAGVSEEHISPREFVSITDWVEVLKPDGKIQRYQRDELQWSYRHCEGWRPGIMTKVGISWRGKKDSSILDQVKQANKVRLLKQPLDWPSCGSVFINPHPHKAAQLIDSCGLKGYTVGAAQVSTKHANFVINLGGARASDIWTLIKHIQKTVKTQKQVSLKTEVVLLGEGFICD